MLVHPDTTPEDLALIELGLPPPDGIPRPLAEHLDRYLGMKRLGPDGIIIPEGLIKEDPDYQPWQ